MPYHNKEKSLPLPLLVQLLVKSFSFLKKREKERTKKKTTQAKIEKWQILDNLSF